MKNTKPRCKGQTGGGGGTTRKGVPDRHGSYQIRTGTHGRRTRTHRKRHAEGSVPGAATSTIFSVPCPSLTFSAT